MLTFITVIHMAVALLICVFVLLQDSKGGAMGALGGGTSNTVFGATGASNFLTKATKWLAVIFAATCVWLAYYTAHQGGSVMTNIADPAPQSTETVPTTAPPAEAPAPSTEQKK